MRPPHANGHALTHGACTDSFISLGSNSTWIGSGLGLGVGQGLGLELGKPLKPEVVLSVQRVVASCSGAS